MESGPKTQRGAIWLLALALCDVAACSVDLTGRSCTTDDDCALDEYCQAWTCVELATDSDLDPDEPIVDVDLGDADGPERDSESDDIDAGADLAVDAPTDPATDRDAAVDPDADPDALADLDAGDLDVDVDVVRDADALDASDAPVCFGADAGGCMPEPPAGSDTGLCPRDAYEDEICLAYFQDAPAFASCPGGAELWPSEEDLHVRAADYSGAIIYATPPSEPANPSADGSRENPYEGIAAALSAASAEDIIALSAGTFHEHVALSTGVALVGACIGLTELQPPAASPDPIVRLTAPQDVLVRDLTVTGEAPGILVENYATENNVIAGVRIDETRVYGLRAVDSVGVVTLHLRDLVVSSVGPDPGDASERSAGMEIVRAAVDGPRLLFSGNRRVGVSVLEGFLSALDFEVENTASTPVGQRYGRGLHVDVDSFVSVNRAAFPQNREVAVVVRGNGTTVYLENAFVRDTAPRASDNRFGRGLDVSLGASVTLVRTELRRQREASIAVRDFGSHVELADVTVVETRARASDSLEGWGLSVDNGGTLEGNRVLLKNSQAAGAVVRDASILELHDLRVRQDGAGASESAQGVVSDESRLDLERFVITGGHTVGALLGPDSTIELVDGSIQGSDIGLNVQIPGFDFGASLTDVVVDANGAHLDTSALPLPSELAAPELLPLD